MVGGVLVFRCRGKVSATPTDRFQFLQADRWRRNTFVRKGKRLISDPELTVPTGYTELLAQIKAEVLAGRDRGRPRGQHRSSGTNLQPYLYAKSPRPGQIQFLQHDAARTGTHHGSEGSHRRPDIQGLVRPLRGQATTMISTAASMNRPRNSRGPTEASLLSDFISEAYADRFGWVLQSASVTRIPIGKWSE